MRNQVVWIAFLLACASTAFAANSGQQTAALVIHHYASSVEVRDSSGKTISNSALRSGLEFRLDPAESYRVVVDDPNPLLFTYAWAAGTPTNTADFDAITAFSDSIGKLSALLAPFLPGKESALAEEKPCKTLRDAEREQMLQKN